MATSTSHRACIEHIEKIVHGFITTGQLSEEHHTHFNKASLDYTAKAFQNEIRHYLDGVGGHSAGLYQMFINARNDQEFDSLINQKLDQCKDTPSGQFKKYLLESLQEKYYQEKKAPKNVNPSWAAQLGKIKQELDHS